MAILTPVNGNSSTWTQYQVGSVCRKITIKEQTQGGTTDYYVADPSDTTKFKTVALGEVFPYCNPQGTFFKPGDIPFQFKTVSGTVLFDRVEE